MCFKIKEYFMKLFNIKNRIELFSNKILGKKRKKLTN